MKWEKSTGSIQRSADGRYLIVHAVAQWWVGYFFEPETPACPWHVELRSEGAVKAACDEHARLRRDVKASPRS